MSSYEDKVQQEKIEKPQLLDFSLVRYLFESNPLRKLKTCNIPIFLRSIDVLKDFSDLELLKFSKFLHLRKFSDGECIFKQNDLGYGFYFIYEGNVDISVTSNRYALKRKTDDLKSSDEYLLNLDKNDYFGELALLQENSVRSATAIAKNNTALLGLFKPDMHDLIENYPVVGTKFLRSLAVIVTNRLFSVTKELQDTKQLLNNYKLKYESKNK